MKKKLNYRCKRDFTSKDGKKFKEENKISEDEYEILFFDDQENFELDNENDEFIEEDDVVDNTAMNIAMGDIIGTGIPGGIDIDFKTLL